MPTTIPVQKLIKLQRKIHKDPERYYRAAFVNSTLSTTLLEGEKITRREVEVLSNDSIEELSRNGYFKRFKSTS